MNNSGLMLISLDVVDLLAEIEGKMRGACSTSAAGKRIRAAKEALGQMFMVGGGVVDGEHLYLVTAAQFGHFIQLRNEANATNGIKNLAAKTVERKDVPKTAIDVTGNAPSQEDCAPAVYQASFAELGEKLDKVYEELSRLKCQPQVEVSLAVNSAEIDLPAEELGNLLRRQAKKISEEINLNLNKRYTGGCNGVR